MARTLLVLEIRETDVAAELTDRVGGRSPVKVEHDRLAGPRTRDLVPNRRRHLLGRYVTGDACQRTQPAEQKMTAAVLRTRVNVVGIGAGRGSRTPKTRRSADFESVAARSVSH